ncbi:Lrp/AsnC family transcriptional regulator [Yinghuangia seranimata]|uniref:Lrp/AsnC family transcriptional regulator n=1 Tax=Yinghuangia seranimata TaxID=408067 RepID=UPI00248C04F3|nr:Lrp/AsnC family transcriptional regulator [Yinghuangia seranimata]MDI2125675.1 Lrp/AsnC family transcriptional regulator [Yinghuangia seranimata]
MLETNAVPGPDALDELDLALVHALQLVPRASWSDLAPVLGAAPATLARRWRRLQASGAAWMTCHPGLAHGTEAPVNSVAMAELTVAPGRIPAVFAELAHHRPVINIEHVTGARDLLICAAASNAGELADYLQTRLPSVPGITSIRVQMPRRLYKDTGAWRLRALDRDQRRRLAELAPAASGAAYPLDAYDRALLAHLGPDGRLSTTELARRLNISAVTAARRLSRLISSGYARFRCELARPLAGWPVTATWWLRVPPADLDATAAELSALGDVRLCVSLTGAANLVVVMWLRQSRDAPAIEADWARRFPRIELVDSAVTLQVVKCMGRLVGTDGLSTGFVPLGLFEPELVDVAS